MLTLPISHPNVIIVMSTGKARFLSLLRREKPSLTFRNSEKPGRRLPGRAFHNANNATANIPEININTTFFVIFMKTERFWQAAH